MCLQHTVLALKERNAMLEKRCERSESRRKLENEGTQRECQHIKKVVTLLNKNFKELIRKSERRNLDVIKKEALEHPEDLEINNLDNVQSPIVLARTKSELMIQAMTAWCDFLNKKAQMLPEIQYANLREIKTIEYIEEKGMNEYGDPTIRYFRDRATQPEEEEVQVLYRHGEPRRVVPPVKKETNEPASSSNRMVRPVWPDIDQAFPSNTDVEAKESGSDDYKEPDTPPPLD